jgi:hypothetical protein
MNFGAIIHALLHVIKCNYKQLRRIAFVAGSDSVHLQHIIQSLIKGTAGDKANWPKTVAQEQGNHSHSICRSAEQPKTWFRAEESH